MGAMSPTHWAIVLVVLVLLFGSTRLPGAARGLGRSLRIFKSEMKEMSGDGQQSSQKSADQAAAATPQALPAQQPANTADPAGQANTTPQAAPAPGAQQPQSAGLQPTTDPAQQNPPAQGAGA